ncbi:hypothetical protein TWF481_010762 [Arthrobotrys musiformis]|uniref:F-box domain-containing protein n=1 Tax=Arthrobotrys musiformis TaxID=47236 RepID=A0AAV9W1N9_9PEZI
MSRATNQRISSLTLSASKNIPRLEQLPVDIKISILETLDDPESLFALMNCCTAFRGLYDAQQSIGVLFRSLKVRVGRAGWLVYVIDRVFKMKKEWEDKMWEKRVGNFAPSSSRENQKGLGEGGSKTKDAFSMIDALKQVEGGYGGGMSKEETKATVRELYQIFRVAKWLWDTCHGALVEMAENERPHRRKRLQPLKPQTPMWLKFIAMMSRGEFETAVYEYWILSRVADSHVGNDWNQKFREGESGGEKVWGRVLFEVFGNPSCEYDLRRFHRLNAIREFVGQSLGRYLLKCGDFAQGLFPDNADTTDPDNKDVKQKGKEKCSEHEVKHNMVLQSDVAPLEQHIRSYVSFEFRNATAMILPREHDCTGYIRFMIRALDLSGVVRLLQSDYDQACETLMLLMPPRFYYGSMHKMVAEEVHRHLRRVCSENKRFGETILFK